MSKDNTKTKKLYKIVEEELKNFALDYTKREEYFGYEYNIEENGNIISYFLDIVQEDNYIELSSIYIVPEEKKDYVKGIIGVNECNRRIIHGSFFIDSVEDNMSIEYFNAVPYLDSEIGKEDIEMLIRMSYDACSNCVDAIVSFMNNEIDFEQFKKLLDNRFDL